MLKDGPAWDRRIEGIPFIIRFKTSLLSTSPSLYVGIEGIPFIIRFKTRNTKVYNRAIAEVLKVFHL